MGGFSHASHDLLCQIDETYSCTLWYMFIMLKSLMFFFPLILAFIETSSLACKVVGFQVIRNLMMPVRYLFIRKKARRV